MAFLEIAPGYILPKEIDELNIEEHLVNKDNILGKMVDEDIFNHENNQSIEELIEWINNSVPTDADNSIERTGHTPVVRATHDLSLHFAVIGDKIDLIIQLLANDASLLHSEDIKSARPLHYAAFNGKNDAVSLLINYGAVVDDPAYGGHTALHFALQKHHYDVAITLITEGKANPQARNKKGEDPISYLLSDLNLQVQRSDSTKVDTILKTLSIALEHCDGGYVTSAEKGYLNGQDIYTPMPVETILRLTAANAPNLEIKDKILREADAISLVDSSHQDYLHALNLMHRFPTGETYEVNFNTKEPAFLASEGHYGLFTTALARDSLGAFVASLSDPKLSLQKELFSELHKIYQHATTYCENAEQTQTYADALARYHQGETILLPSGWHGHFVDVILSKQQATYAMANSGDRYTGEEPPEGLEKTEFGDNAGLSFYELAEPDSIDEDFINHTINNTSAQHLEFEQPMKYGLLNKMFEINNPDQQYGNCGWESHRDAVEGILVIELLNRNIPLEQALPMAKENYEAWDLFHGNYVIDQYMEHHPALGIDAMMHVWASLHQGEPSSKDVMHAQKLVDTVLLSNKYISDFKEAIMEMAASPDHKEVISAFEDYHVDVKGMVSEAQSAVLDQNQTQPMDVAHHVPQFNIAHQLMTEPAIIQEILAI